MRLGVVVAIEMELTTEKLPQCKGEGGEGDEWGERSS